jgi:Rad3-related DNA helicase
MIERRKGQLDIAQRVVDAFSTHDVVVLEAPTGSGKSGIAYFTNELMGGSCAILSHQKILQDQYESLLNGAPGVISVKGRDNYECLVDPELTVAHAYCQFNGGKCDIKSRCVYYSKRRKMETLPVVLTNYQLLFSLLDTNTFNFPKDLFVYDECHNIQQIFTDYRKVRVGNTDVRSYEKAIPLMEDLGYSTVTRLCKENLELVRATDFRGLDKKTVFPFLSAFFSCRRMIIASLKHHLRNDIHAMSDHDARRVTKFMSFESDSCCKYSNLAEQQADIADCDNFVVEKFIDPKKYEITLTPIEIGNMFNRITSPVSRKKLFMSSTIFGASHFLRELGVNGGFESIVLPSRFPLENRKVFVLPVVSLNKKKIDEGYDGLSGYFKMMGLITGAHAEKGDSGLIFVPSYQMVNMVLDHMRRVFERQGFSVLFNNSSSERNDVIDTFRYRDGRMKLLVSPSFFEGVNFENDISRFQVVAKVPYKSLGSEYVKAKLERSQLWYSLEALKQVVQACGRSIRSRDDYALTYVIDANFATLFSRYGEYLPAWFREAVEVVRK